MSARLARRGVFRAALLALALVPMLAGCGPSDNDAAPDERPAGEEPPGVVSLTPDLLRNAGIKTAPAGPAKLAVRLRLTATVHDNLDRQVHVNPKVSGVVHAIFVKLGETVAMGDPLCEIDSVELGGVAADYLKDRAVAEAAAETLKRSGELFVRRLETQRRVLNGAIEIAKTIYEREKSLKDRELTTLRPYLMAEKEYKQALFARERDLALLEATRDARLLELEVALRTARVEMESAENRLHILGLTEDSILALKTDQGISLGRFTVLAPTGGIITARDSTLNEFVDTGTKLFEIDNLERAWVVASVYEKDLASVRMGEVAEVRLTAFPEAVFRGAVTYVSHAIDIYTRTAEVRVELDNKPIPAWNEPFPIRAGMFGSVELVISSFDVPIAVPSACLVRDGTDQFLLVRTNELTFERRDVRIGRRSPESVEILSGLRAGEAVVSAGTFELKSILQKEQLGEGDE